VAEAVRRRRQAKHERSKFRQQEQHWRKFDQHCGDAFPRRLR
jgi:hypothetical protein